jgi:hypothetical protein
MISRQSKFDGATPLARQYVDEGVGFEMYGDHVPWDGQIEQFVYG